MGNEIGVDDGVKQVIIHRIVHVRVLIIVAPDRRVRVFEQLPIGVNHIPACAIRQEKQIV